MNDFSVGDFAEQMMKEQKESINTPFAPPLPSPQRSSDYVDAEPLDISKVSVPDNFLQAINEGAEIELPPPPPQVAVKEDKIELSKANPVAEQAIDIVLEGLRSMLATVSETLQEVKQFVNENSLTNEVTGTGSGSIGVNQGSSSPSPSSKPCLEKPKSKKKEEPKKKEDKLKTILAQIRDRATANR